MAWFFSMWEEVQVEGIPFQSQEVSPRWPTWQCPPSTSSSPSAAPSQLNILLNLIALPLHKWQWNWSHLWLSLVLCRFSPGYGGHRNISLGSWSHSQLQLSRIRARQVSTFIRFVICSKSGKKWNWFCDSNCFMALVTCFMYMVFWCRWAAKFDVVKILATVLMSVRKKLTVCLPKFASTCFFSPAPVAYCELRCSFFYSKSFSICADSECSNQTTPLVHQGGGGGGTGGLSSNSGHTSAGGGGAVDYNNAELYENTDSSHAIFRPQGTSTHFIEVWTKKYIWSFHLRRYGKFFLHS